MTGLDLYHCLRLWILLQIITCINHSLVDYYLVHHGGVSAIGVEIVAAVFVIPRWPRRLAFVCRHDGVFFFLTTSTRRNGN
jgi:hypothetical protein